MTRPVADEQGSLPGLTNLPEGFQYRPDFIDPATERSLIGELQKLDFTPFQFHGFEGKRRVVSFGWRYDFNGGGLKRTDDFPPFLVPIRDAAAAAFGLEGSSLEQALLIEYGDVIGISLLSPCTFRFRRKAGARWERRAITAEPRSAYLLQGPSRDEWEHGIPAVSGQRYAITFRSLRAATGG
jgi:alkylated DNA repair dioxygenase AlkB